MPDLISSTFIIQVFGALAFFCAIFFGIFLYWRAGRHELVDNQVLFDVIAFFAIGAFLGGRIADFVWRSDFYNWSPVKLIFFNAFWGFDVYGAFLGGAVGIWIYLRKKKENYWDVFDFGSEGLAFGIFLYFFLRLIGIFVGTGEFSQALAARAICYLILFWSIKRIAKQKKHRGFFASWFLIWAAVINFVFRLIGHGDYQFKNLIWPEWFLALICLVVGINWYRLAKRKVSDDVQNFFGQVLLFLLKGKRVVTNIREADNSAKAIVLSPYYLVKGVWFLVKYILREIVLSFSDLKRSFGLGK